MKTAIAFKSYFVSLKCPYCNASGILKKGNSFNKNFSLRCPECHEIFELKLNDRKHYRKKVSIPVYYSLDDIKDPFDLKVKRGEIIDISKSGFFIKTILNKDSLQNYIEQDGNILKCLFSLPPKNDQIKVQAKIVNIISQTKNNQINIGVKFLALDEHLKKQIGFFLF